MATEENVAEMLGKVDALMMLCATIVALHPSRSNIIEVLKRGALDEAKKKQNVRPLVKNYVAGIQSVVSALEAAAQTAAQAEQIRDVKPQGGH